VDGRDENLIPGKIFCAIMVVLAIRPTLLSLDVDEYGFPGGSWSMYSQDVEVLSLRLDQVSEGNRIEVSVDLWHGEFISTTHPYFSEVQFEDYLESRKNLCESPEITSLEFEILFLADGKEYSFSESLLC